MKPRRPRPPHEHTDRTNKPYPSSSRPSGRRSTATMRGAMDNFDRPSRDPNHSSADADLAPRVGSFNACKWDLPSANAFTAELRRVGDDRKRTIRLITPYGAGGNQLLKEIRPADDISDAFPYMSSLGVEYDRNDGDPEPREGLGRFLQDVEIAQSAEFHKEFQRLQAEIDWKKAGGEGTPPPPEPPAAEQPVQAGKPAFQLAPDRSILDQPRVARRKYVKKRKVEDPSAEDHVPKKRKAPQSKRAQRSKAPAESQETTSKPQDLPHSKVPDEPQQAKAPAESQDTSTRLQETIAKAQDPPKAEALSESQEATAKPQDQPKEAATLKPKKAPKSKVRSESQERRDKQGLANKALFDSLRPEQHKNGRPIVSKRQETFHKQIGEGGEGTAESLQAQIDKGVQELIGLSEAAERKL